MFLRLTSLAASVLLLSGCAQTQPVVGPSTPEAPSSSPSVSQSPSVSPTATPASNPLLEKFLGHMATTCIYAQGVGVTETVSTNGVLDGSLILLPKKEAILDGYTAGWIPADGSPAEVIFESDAFDSCALANMDSLAKESGSDLSGSVTVKFDEVTQIFTATTDFGDFSRTAKYQVGDGGIVYSVVGTDASGKEIATAMKFGMPKAEHIAALTAAVKALLADQ